MAGPVSVRELMILLGPAAFGPRPFYVIGHNTNTIREVEDALDQGANAVEPDVNVYLGDELRLCISHFQGLPTAPPLVEFLQDLRAVALARPRLALVLFDCKVSRPRLGRALLDAIRTHLTPGTGLNVVISVATFDMTRFFEEISADLGPREGLMIDQENYPRAVARFFTGEGVTFQGFGNGSIPEAGDILAPNVRPTMEHACFLRAAEDSTRLIIVWTVDGEERMHEFIHIGVDGMITDDVRQLRRVMREFDGVIRLAERTDHPFLPPNAGYGLRIRTADDSLAGTDANVTFTLTGSLGSASSTVNTFLRFRMERGDINYVTIQSDDLGELRTISVRRDNAGFGEDWKLDWIRIESFRYGTSTLARFNGWIDGTSTFTMDL
jgi:glycerophosphoryl diester phosphodiesterase